MKAIIAFDSVYGNTRMVADELATEFRERGYESQVIDLRQWDNKTPSGDVLFVGSPTRVVRMTRPAKRFAKKLDVRTWEGKPIYAFDTIMLPSDPEQQRKAAKWTDNGAAPRLKDLLVRRGLMVQDKMLRVPVTGLKGPLADTWKDQIKSFVGEVIANN